MTVTRYPQGASSLDGLGDVAVSSASRGQILAHNGTLYRNRSNHVFDVRDWGAVGDGTTDDTDAIQAAINAASAAGGGDVFFPAGTYAIASSIAIPTGVNIIGAGGATLGGKTTTIKATNAAARLAFGAQEDGGTYGGRSSGFHLDGNNISATMLSLGRTLERQFIGVAVTNCAAGAYAVVIEEAQNTQWLGLVVNSNRGGGISFDRGCGGNRFFGVEARSNGVNGGYHVRFTATDATVASLVAYPLRTTFYDSIFEDDGGLLDGAIYHGAGADNAFIRCNLAAGASASRAFPLVKMAVGNSGITTQSTRLSFHNCQFTGTQAQTTAFDLDNASIVDILGKTLVQGFLNVFLLRDASSRVWVERTLIYSAVTNRNSASSVGVLNTAVRSRYGDPIEVIRSATADTVLASSVEGDAGIRFSLNALGTMIFGSGADAGDVNLFRQQADLLRTNDSLQVDKGLWSQAVRNVTTTATVTFSDHIVTADAGSGALTVNLPSTSGLTGFQVTIIRTSAANNVTVDGNGSDTISGPGINAALTATLGSQHAFATFKCTAANVWRIIAMGGTVT